MNSAARLEFVRKFEQHQRRRDSPRVPVAQHAAARKPAMRPAPLIVEERGLDEQWRVAFHEAGHAVAALKVGATVLSASIESDATSSGRIVVRDQGLDAERRVALRFSGAYAEARWQGRSCTDVWLVLGDDREHIEQITRDDDVRLSGMALACELIDCHWPAVQRVASALIEHRFLDFTNIMRVMAGWPMRPA